MANDSCGEITSLLADVAAGKPGAQDALVTLVYQVLHDMAHRLMSRERRNHSWDTTDLLDEAYWELFKGTVPTKNRRYFFGAAWKAMCRLLIEHARSHKREPTIHLGPLDPVVGPASPESGEIRIE